MASNKKYLADGLKFAEVQWKLAVGKKIIGSMTLTVSVSLEICTEDSCTMVCNGDDRVML